MTSLWVAPAGSAVRYRVWPDPEPLPPGALQEAQEHLFELTAPDAGLADLYIDDAPLEALRTRDPGLARWRWSPGFHAGAVEARLRLADRQHEFEIVTDPAERKLTREAFDLMVSEILEDTFALFSLSGFRTSVARGAGGRPPPIARLEYLRSRIRELVRIVRAIDASPRRLLKGEEAEVPLHRAHGATGVEVLRSFRTGRLLTAAGHLRLAPALRGRLPARIRKRVRRSSLDLPEHRQMKACLAAWSRWLAGAAVTLGGARMEDPELSSAMALWSRRARRLSLEIRALTQLPMFEGVGEADPRPAASPLWRGDPRYRSFLRIHREISLGIANVSGDFLQMPLARTFELYELWAFLRLLRAAVSRHGMAPGAPGELFQPAGAGITIASGSICVPLQEGVSLCFQRRYREFWVEPDQRGSLSRDMQPDVVIETGASAAERRLIVLDAKYRMGRDLNDALSSIHMYRDALVTPAGDAGVEGIVTAAYLLTPDAPAAASDWRGAPLPGRLFHPVYRSTFRFGAVTLRPGMTQADVEAALEIILRDATAGADDGRPAQRQPDEEPFRDPAAGG